MNKPIVDRARIYTLESETARPRSGTVVYWMSRDQRIDDNWAFLYAAETAERTGSPLAVVFTLIMDYPGATTRAYRLMLEGLKETAARAEALGVSFHILRGGEPPDLIREFCDAIGAAEVICDFDPLRIKQGWQKQLARSLDIPVTEVDAHNILPCRHVSGKQEFAAYTLRPKIGRELARFLTPFPGTEDALKGVMLESSRQKGPGSIAGSAAALIDEITAGLTPDSPDRLFRQPENFRPGYEAGMAALYEFLSSRLENYSDLRNDPCSNALSNLSPYLHFGQISPQAAALEAARVMGDAPLKGGFLDEIIVRRELSDNFCLHNPFYDTAEGFPDWARKSLDEHSGDTREFIYKLDDFEKAETHDALWNAAQTEMAVTGKMHGYMRMYWAKKILEWSRTPAEAMAAAVYLNDKYSLDGRDPNGYAGCAWAIGGLHDRAWQERPVFGKIRYMNYNGCRRKFDVDAYISKFASGYFKP